MDNIDPLIADARIDFAAAKTPAQLEDAKARYLGKSGRVTDRLKALSALPIDAKKAAGALVNALKQSVEAELAARRTELSQAALDAQLAAESLDVTLPGRRHSGGSIHPVSLAMERVAQIFGSMGFDVADGPEIETDWYSFTALNNPENHPARSMADTFYVDVKDADGRWLNLRPHTSPMQVRYAQAHARVHAGAATMPDVRVIAPGRTYRVDSDSTHSPMFHQVEGLWIGENVSFRDLKALYLDFIQAFFETTALKLRFRPSYFPFTEPSAEIDVMFETGPLKGRWLEVSGSGQVHPQVVRNMGIDPERYMGFAFGSGVDRLAMLRYGIDDLRVFFDSDQRFLSQFG